MKIILKYQFAFLLFIVACNNQKIAEKPTKPNILFILVDDLGINDLGVTGSAFYETPNIDLIAKEGTSFTQGYASSRVCSPSRASIMTGQFTARHGITDWIGAKQGKEWRDHSRHDKLLPATYNRSLSAKDITIAEAMANAGYRTFFAGKWHLGGKGSGPEDHGFSINKGGWDKGSPKGGYFSPWENPKLKNRYDGENLTMRLARETADFIKENKDSSFFAFLSFYAVHGPIQTTQSLWSKYREKAIKKEVGENGFKMEKILPIRMHQDNPVYAGLIETTDKAIGVVLEALKANGLDNNTIIVFTSDNGGVASGDAYSTSNLPYRGGKGYQWEGGLRVPYFIKVPWLKETSNMKIAFPVTGADFYPTLLDLINIKRPSGQEMDGISLKPLFHGGQLEDRPIFWHYPHYGNQGGEPSSILRYGPWKLIHYWEDERVELYNLGNDPYENYEVSLQNPLVSDSLSMQLKHWLTKVDANYAAVDTTFDPYLFNQRLIENKEKLMVRLENERKQMLSEDFSPNEDWWGSKVTNE